MEKMEKNDSLPENESEPIQETTQANKQDSEQKSDVFAPLPIVNPSDAKDEELKPAESYDETDRKQDEAIDSIADQTVWIARQTKWVRAQTIASSFLGVVTLAVLVYHGLMMRGQLEAMQSSSAQTQQMLEAAQKQASASHDIAAATSKQADASQSLTEQNKDLVGQAGEQTKAMQTQADASVAQSEAAKQFADSSVISARAAEQGVSVASDSMKLGARAWVVARGMSIQIPLLNAPAMTIPINIENGGTTPALHVRVRVADKLFTFEPDDLDFSRINMPVGKYNIASHATLPVQYKFVPFSGAQKLQLTQQGYKLYIWGVVEYEDIFGRTHKTKFCYVIPSSERTEVNSCVNPKYNTID